MLISPQPELLPGIFCLMVRIFRLMLVSFYVYIYIYIYIYMYIHVYICIKSTNIPPIVIINRIYEAQNFQSL